MRMILNKACFLPATLRTAFVPAVFLPLLGKKMIFAKKHAKGVSTYPTQQLHPRRYGSGALTKET
ncbi:hypothetical protein [Candidatus Electronema sp. JM]|uniref:hypothetical protein n=1 Tax=Candidatus Electronema sp. JM TaxID=3401571 RepID=UPI003AA86950